MADQKISQLTAYTTPLSADLLPIVDTANTTTKSIAWSALLTALASAVQTFTNKTFDTAGTGNVFKINGTSVTAVNGTGAVSLTTSPAFVTPTLGAAIATSFAAATNAAINLISGTYNTIQTYTPSGAGTATLDLSKGNVHHITMPAGNITIAISNGNIGQCFIVRILQDGTGSRTVTWFTTIKWAGGSAPTLTTTASKADTMGFEITGSSTYDGGAVFANV